MVEHNRQYPPEALERLHAATLTILDAIADVCQRANIRWYLAAGTALGALRHGGFIPWDDDIDVGMMRPDYDRFLEIAAQELPDEFELLAPGITPNYAPLFAKVALKGTRFWTDETIEAGFEQGIFVDVFPRDLVAADPVVQARQARNAAVWAASSYLYHSDKVHAIVPGLKGRIAQIAYPGLHRLLRSVTDETFIRDHFDRGIAISPGTKTVGTTSFPCRGMKILPESLFEDYELLEFEGRTYPAPTPCEEYCRLVYGENWNELPPEDKRVNHAPYVLDFGDGVNALR